MSRGQVSIGGQVISVETQNRLMLMHQRIRMRAGREMLPVGKLPRGNSYCLWCAYPCFVTPEDGVIVELSTFCNNCDFLFAEGVL